MAWGWGPAGVLGRQELVSPTAPLWADPSADPRAENLAGPAQGPASAGLPTLLSLGRQMTRPGRPLCAGTSPSVHLPPAGATCSERGPVGVVTPALVTHNLGAPGVGLPLMQPGPRGSPVLLAAQAILCRGQRTHGTWPAEGRTGMLEDRWGLDPQPALCGNTVPSPQRDQGRRAGGAPDRTAWGLGCIWVYRRLRRWCRCAAMQGQPPALASGGGGAWFPQPWQPCSAAAGGGADVSPGPLVTPGLDL